VSKLIQNNDDLPTNKYNYSMPRSLDFVAPVSGKTGFWKNTIRTVTGETDESLIARRTSDLFIQRRFLWDKFRGDVFYQTVDSGPMLPPVQLPG